MKNHFKPKSLAFYGGAILIVTALFSVVTAYGESNLKAPRSIKGQYRLAAQALPGCLKSDVLLLTVQQSGIYLNGTLVPGNASDQQIQKAEERPALTGSWDNQQFQLQGPIRTIPQCEGTVSLQGQVEEKTLKGTIAQDSASPGVEFTAEREPEKPAQKSGH